MSAAPPVLITSRQAGKLVREGLGWAWEPPESSGVRFLADAIEYRGRELHAEVEVTVRGGHVHMATYNLSMERSRQDLVRALIGKTSTPDEDRMGSPWPWSRLVEQFCVGVIKKEREGEALQYTAASLPRRKEYLVDQLMMKNKTNLLIAPGGHGKGIIAVGITVGLSAHRGLGDLTVQAAVPIYFDWEDQYADYDDRVNAYCRGHSIEVPAIAYQRMHGPVPDRLQMMSRKVQESGANCGIIDSMSAAMGTTGTSGSWDTIAQRFFDSLDLIECADGSPMSWFIIGHVSGEGLKGLVGKAFGSIQIMNRARNAWEMRSTQEPGSSTVHMRLYDAKWNHTGLRRPIGFRMEWGRDSVRINSEDPTSINRYGNEATIADRIETILFRRPLSAGIMASELALPENKVRAVLSQNKDRFEKDSGGYWSLAPDEQPQVADGPLPW